MYNATLAATLSNMILIDNHIGGTMLLMGDGINQNNTELAMFEDSYFYGETEARDCIQQSMCANANTDPT